MLPLSERHNIRQLEELNQRGGRMLTVVDLIEAGTLSVEMAATVMEALAKGSSVLTGARPGGAGKTTVMAAFLNLLPPEVTIVTVDDPAIIQRSMERPPQQPMCYLVHEIGAGHWYGYLWGRPVADFFRLAARPHRIASCLHADTLEELIEILVGPPLQVNLSDINQVGILGFMRMDRSPRGPVERRLATLHIRYPYVAESCRFVYRSAGNNFSREPWNDENVTCSTAQIHSGTVSQGSFSGTARQRTFYDFIEHLMKVGARTLADVREEVLAFYRHNSQSTA